MEKYNIIKNISKDGMAKVDLVKNKKGTFLIRKSYTISAYFKYYERERMILENYSILHFPTLIDYGQDDESRVLIMEYIKGVTLYEYIKNNKATLDEIELVFNKIVHALKCFNRICGGEIKFSDLNPKNIIVREDSEISFVDFQAAYYKHEKPSLLSFGFNQDTKIHNSNTEIFALGKLYLFMLTKVIEPDAIKLLKYEKKKFLIKCLYTNGYQRIDDLYEERFLKTSNLNYNIGILGSEEVLLEMYFAYLDKYRLVNIILPKRGLSFLSGYLHITNNTQIGNEKNKGINLFLLDENRSEKIDKCIFVIRGIYQEMESVANRLRPNIDMVIIFPYNSRFMLPKKSIEAFFGALVPVFFLKESKKRNNSYIIDYEKYLNKYPKKYYRKVIDYLSKED